SLIQPTAHYAMGGIPTNTDGEVVVDDTGTRKVLGLYAAGECACVSVHGANRLGTNSLLDIVVFGKRGGASMASYVAKAEMPTPPAGAHEPTRQRIERLLTGGGTQKTAELRSRRQGEMQTKASVFRSGDSLRSCLASI